MAIFQNIPKKNSEDVDKYPRGNSGNIKYMQWRLLFYFDNFFVFSLKQIGYKPS